MKAADLMTSFVVTVRPDATIEYAAQLMLQYRISGLPVTDSDGACLGTVTESDLLRRAEAGRRQINGAMRSKSLSFTNSYSRQKFYPQPRALYDRLAAPQFCSRFRTSASLK